MAASLLATPAFSAEPCLTPLRAGIYHDGWVDLNKNGSSPGGK